MVNKVRVSRELNTRDVELYRIYSYEYELEYYVLLVDLRRRSSIDDFEYLRGIEDEEDFSRSNLIVGAYITSNHVEEELFECVYTIVSDLIENKEDCHKNLELFIDEDIPEELGFGVNVVSFVNKYLEKLKIKTIPDIELSNFNYLSQD